MSPANVHDSTKFIDVMENISDFVDDDMMREIASVYADKGYDSGAIRDYLKNRNINPCIPFRKNNNEATKNKSYKKYNKIRYVVERFFAWLKNGFRRTAIRYERVSENYLGLVNIASFLMYCRVLR